MLIAFFNPKQELSNKIKIKSGNLVSHSEKIHNELASLLDGSFLLTKVPHIYIYIYIYINYG